MSNRRKHYDYDTGYFAGECQKCGVHLPKRDLYRIYASDGRYGPVKRLAYVCFECAVSVCDFLGCDLPELERATPEYVHLHTKQQEADK